MKLTQYAKGQESETQWDIPDDNVEGFLRDQLGFKLADAWEEGNVRSLRFENKEVKPGRALASCIVVLEIEGVFTATLYDYPMEMGNHLRARLASLQTQPATFIEELNKLPNTVNDHLTLYAILGGHITDTQTLAFQSAEPVLLQDVKAILAELRIGDKIIHETEAFAVRLKQGQNQERSGIIEFELNNEDWRQNFALFLSGYDISLQEAGLFGALSGASFNTQFQSTLSERNADEGTLRNSPLPAEEAHKIARQILSDRPALITVLPVYSNNSALRTRWTHFALHFALAILNPQIL